MDDQPVEPMKAAAPAQAHYATWMRTGAMDDPSADMQPIMANPDAAPQEVKTGTEFDPDDEAPAGYSYGSGHVGKYADRLKALQKYRPRRAN